MGYIPNSPQLITYLYVIPSRRFAPREYSGVGSWPASMGPLTNDTLTFEYDELGRTTQELVNGVGMSVTYDVLGRTTSEVNALGTFTYTYDGVTNRIASATYPNGQTTAYTYYDDQGDRRLQTIHHKYPGGATLYASVITNIHALCARPVRGSRRRPAAPKSTWASSPAGHSTRTHASGWRGSRRRTKRYTDA